MLDGRISPSPYQFRRSDLIITSRDLVACQAFSFIGNSILVFVDAWHG